MRRVPPHFSILPESTEVASGGAVNLTCVAVGSPMPQVRDGVYTEQVVVGLIIILVVALFCSNSVASFLISQGMRATTKPVHRLQIRPPNNAQVGGTPYHFPKLHSGRCSSVGMRRETDRHRHTDGGRPICISVGYARCEMYCEFVMTAICLSVCVSVCPSPHSCTTVRTRM